MIVKVAGIYFIYFIGWGSAFQRPFLGKKKKRAGAACSPPAFLGRFRCSSLALTKQAHRQHRHDAEDAADAGPCWGAVPGEQEPNQPARCAAPRCRHRRCVGAESRWRRCCRSIPGSQGGGVPPGALPVGHGAFQRGSVPVTPWSCLPRWDLPARWQNRCWSGCRWRCGHANPSTTSGLTTSHLFCNL